MKAAYPQPREDADNAAFLRSWRDGVVLIQRCRPCRTAFFYPRPLCPRCWSADLKAEEASGRGRIVSWSAIERPNDPAFNDEVPILLAEILLAEGATLLARVVGCTREQIASGAAVKLPPRAIAERYPLPVFQLYPEARP